jgi:hypothetical protein
MFCGCASHLNEFCFRRKRIKKSHFEYAINSYCDEFSDFPPRSYSHAPPHSYYRASPHTSSRALPQFSHGPNHCSYGFGSQENRFVLRRFGYTHVLIVVIIFRVGLIFLLGLLTFTLSQDIRMVHIFPVIVHVPLGQVVRC